jgi:hypothetical protein
MRDTTRYPDVLGDAFQLLSKTRIDHKMGKILLASGVADVITFAAQRFRGSIMRGASTSNDGNCAIRQVDWSGLSSADTALIYNAIINNLVKSTENNIKNAVAYALETKNPALIRAAFKSHPVQVRNQLLCTNRIENFKKSARMREELIKILESCTSEDMSLEKRCDIFETHYCEYNAIMTMIVMNAGPVKTIDPDMVADDSWKFMMNDQFKLLRREMMTSHSFVQLLKNLPTVRQLLSEGNDTLLTPKDYS